MYPNQQGYPGQYPQQPPFGAGYPMPMPGMPQAPAAPFGAGYQMPGYNQPQIPAYGQPPQVPGGFPPTQAPSAYPPTQTPSAYPPTQTPGAFPQQGYQSPPQQGYQAPPQQGYQSPPQQGYQAPPQQGYQAPGAYPQLPTSDYAGMSPMHQQQSGYQGYGSAPPPQMTQQYASQSYGAQSMPVSKGRPTITPAQPFDASNDAGVLRKAMKGFGTDEDSLINVLCRRPSHQRVEITRMYKTAYGKDLERDIASETSGNFQRVLTSLLVPIPELYCRELREAMLGVGTDEDALIEVMCTMTNAEIRNICQYYYRMYGTPLEQDLRADTSGNMKRLMTSLATGNRDESMRTDIGQAKADAEALRRAGVGRWGTDESEFNRILCTRNYEQLKLICQEYQNLTGSSLEKDIKREFSGDIEDALLAIIRVANNRSEFFARRLHKSMAGLGTNDNSLIRLVITRAEVDMVDVKSEFQRYYGKSLRDFISGDTSGHYKHALYALIGENKKDGFVRDMLEGFW